MLLSFQACPDVQGTESTGEPLNEQLTFPRSPPQKAKKTARTKTIIRPEPADSPFFHLFSFLSHRPITN
jgi:hypothetical protein